MKKPYLVQRGTIKEDISSDMPLSEAVNFDYMGSSEFEWGAIPRAFRYLKDNSNSLRRCRIKIRGKHLWIFHCFKSEEELNQYISYLEAMIDRKINLKERTNFDSHFKAFQKANDRDPIRNRMIERDNKHIKYEQRINFWWDIENGVIWAFDNNFASLFVDIISESFKRIKED